ncbi:MAG: TatD family hydrolase [Phycisphaerae bacterium]|nr:TatD family hydrolase [Phycisphaerae bacterium]
MLIDTHAHLTYPPLSDETDQIIARAQQAGVMRILTVGTSPEDSRSAVALAEKYENVFAIVGIHPNDANAYPSLDELRPLLLSPKVLALGETGLDYHHSDADHENQHRLFIQHIELARETHLPLIVHCREAFDDTLSILGTSGREARGVFHCFSGTPEQATFLIEQGWLISFSGTVTFKTLKRFAAVLLRSARIISLSKPIVHFCRPNRCERFVRMNPLLWPIPPGFWRICLGCRWNVFRKKRSKTLKKFSARN